MKRYMNRVEFWDDERSMGNSLIVTLHYGWSFSDPGHEGVWGFDTIKEAREAIKNSVPCNCPDCIKFGKGGKNAENQKGFEGVN